MIRLLLFLIVLGLPFTGMAQQIAPRPKAKTALHANRLRMAEIVPGAITWPLGPDNQRDYSRPPVSVDFDGLPKAAAGVSAAGLWLGALDTSGQVRVSCATYNVTGVNNPFVAGPIDGNWPADSLNALRWDRFFKADKAALEKHRADWVDNGVLDNPLPAIVGWPGRGNPHFENQYGFPLPGGDLAPFRDVNGDGIYNAFDGDYPHPSSLDPDVVPGEIIWNIFNDAYGNFLGVPLGVELQSTCWALTCEGDHLLNETVFFSYKIRNRSGADLDSVVAGMWIDPNLGYYWDDCWGTNVASNSIFIYNSNNNDTVYMTNNNPYSFGHNPPTASLTYLDRDLYKSMYHIGILLCDPPLEYLQPFSSASYYNHLNGRWNNGTPLTYGGSGYDYTNVGLPVTDFVLPGDPAIDTSWTMINTSIPCRFMAMSLSSLLIGHLAVDSVFSFETAFSYHRGPGLNHFQNVAYCYDRVDQLHQLYEENFAGSCTHSASCTDDCVWPGDFDRNGIVSVHDLLPLGVGWKAEGPTRPGLVNWAPHTADDWGISLDNQYDFKHIDANGDGALDSVDMTIMQVFDGLSVPDYVVPADAYVIGDGLWMTHANGNINPNNIQNSQIAAMRVRIADAPALYGVAFEIEYDTAYWKPYDIGDISLSPGLQIINPRDGGVDVAAIYTDTTKVFVPNQNLILIFLRARAIPDSLPDTTLVRIKNIRGVRADGSEIPMSANFLRYCFGGGCPLYVGIPDVEMGKTSIYPNPSTGRIFVDTPGATRDYIEAFDPAGRLLKRWETPDSEQSELDLDGLPNGWLLIRINGANAVSQHRVLLLR